MSFKKYFLLGSLFFICSPGLFAQSFTLQGKVITDKGTPIADAHIYLTETKWAISDENGAFTIPSLKAADYVMVVTRVGYNEEKIPISPGDEATLQVSVTLTEKVYNGEHIVITASRTAKDLEDVSVPITVIDDREIESTGSLRLSDVLNEQIGLNLVNDHGTGIQLQGFDPEYTLIMIDNQPVIGRTAGTLDLSRLAIGNVKQIEMVKGPSSALWGSDALAGVINIITDKGSEPISWDLNTRYGSNTSYDASTNMSFKADRLTGNFFANANGSQGFDLDKSTPAPTIPKYENLTLSGGLRYRLNRTFNFRINSRYYREEQNYDSEITVGTQQNLMKGYDFQDDISVSPEISATLSDKLLIEASAYLSAFFNESDLSYASSGDVYSNTTFDQRLNKFELKGSSFWNSNHTTVAGAGMNREDLTAEIYASVPYFDSYFTFAQHEWSLSNKLSFTGGFRFDAHSEYSSQFSPKFSGLYKPTEHIHVRASLGGGFKAPDFRQLFLNFTNPTAGYSVFGSSTVEAGITELQREGQIQELYFDPSLMDELKSEHSFAYNAGIDLFPVDEVQIRLNAFRNDVEDLIETQRIALKTNGQFVFGYFNLNKIYTQGIESEFRYSPAYIRGLRMSIGYQYLDARREITRTFDRVENGQVVSRTEKSFVPMFNRSKHTANFKLFYYLDSLGLDASFRIQHRGQYGFADFNSNETIDGNEYAEAHTIINTSLAKTFSERYRLQVGINNLANYTDAQYLPSNPGTTFFAQLNIQLY